MSFVLQSPDPTADKYDHLLKSMYIKNWQMFDLFLNQTNFLQPYVSEV